MNLVQSLRARSAAPSSRVLATVLLANALEFFDFFAYASFAFFINRAFFPHVSILRGELLATGIFAAGFLSRPIGALLVGSYADRVGRKPALLLTAALATVGTLGLAVIPGFASMGVCAPILVLLCRIIQGIAIGGEVGSSAALLIEMCAPERRGYYAAWHMAGQGIALLAVGFAGIAIVNTLTPEQVMTWAWRIPFACGAMLLPVQWQLRKRLREDHVQAIDIDRRVNERRYKSSRWVFAVGLIMGGTVPTYVAAYVATLNTASHTTPASAAFVTTLTTGAAVFGASLLGGWLSDVFGRARVIVWARMATILAVSPSILFASAMTTGLPLVIVTLFSALSALAAGPTLVLILEMFPRRRRAMGLATIYAVGVALFGGSTPFVITALTGWTGVQSVAPWYIICASLVSIVSVYLCDGLLSNTETDG